MPPICYRDICRGLQLVLWGLIEIVVVALRCAEIVLRVIDKGDISGVHIVALVLFFVIGAFTFVDGAWNILRGISEIMGRPRCSLIKHKHSIRDWIEHRNIVIRWIIYIGAICLLVICGCYGPDI